MGSARDRADAPCARAILASVISRLPNTFPVGSPSRLQAAQLPRARDRSGILVFPGHGGGRGHGMQRTTVELPFSDLMPTCMGPIGPALDACSDTLDDLSAGERDIVLANLLAKYGETQR